MSNNIARCWKSRFTAHLSSRNKDKNCSDFGDSRILLLVRFPPWASSRVWWGYSIRKIPLYFRNYEKWKEEGCQWLKNKENLGGNELAVCCWRARESRFCEARITGQNLFLKNEGFITLSHKYKRYNMCFASPLRKLCFRDNIFFRDIVRIVRMVGNSRTCVSVCACVSDFQCFTPR